VTEIKTIEVLMARIDPLDDDFGSVRWQDIMTHNIIVSLLKGEPLTDEEMTFLEVQNDHLRR